MPTHLTEVWPADGETGRTNVSRKGHRPVSLPKVTSEVRTLKEVEQPYSAHHHASTRGSQERPTASLGYAQPVSPHLDQGLPIETDQLVDLNHQEKDGCRPWRNSGEGKLRRARSTTLLTNMARRRTSGNIPSTATLIVTLQGHCKMSWIGMLRRTRFLRLVQDRLYCYDARVRALLWSVLVSGARVRILPRHRIVLSKLSTGSVVEFSVYDEVSCRLWGSALLQASIISHNAQTSQQVNGEGRPVLLDPRGKIKEEHCMPRSRSAVDIWPQGAFDESSCSGRLKEFPSRHVQWMDCTNKK